LKEDLILPALMPALHTAFIMVMWKKLVEESVRKNFWCGIRALPDNRY